MAPQHRAPKFNCLWIISLSDGGRRPPAQPVGVGGGVAEGGGDSRATGR